MHRYIVMYDCYWNDNYPVNHTNGEFPLYVDNDLEAIYYIKNKFLNCRELLSYHFIVSSENDVFEIKIGA